MKPTLLILAAGMGSRYGKLKQMDAFGPNGETIIDYSLFDAINAGFGKVVFIVRASFRKEFEDFFRQKLDGKIEVAFVNQEIDDVPQNVVYDTSREKPWGTAHAVWAARHVINEPFGVINADDYYGVDSFRQLRDFLVYAHDNHIVDYAVVGYHLANTLSEHGTVNRGVCKKNAEGNLVSIKECTKIQRTEEGNIVYTEGGNIHHLNEKEIVSMNMWGFLPSYFEHCEQSFYEFIKKYGDNPVSEYYIPTIIDELITQNILQVKVIDTDSDWFGVTYQEDKPFVMKKINQLIQNETYPIKLWN